jgi:hypothetical protein
MKDVTGIFRSRGSYIPFCSLIELHEIPKQESHNNRYYTKDEMNGYESPGLIFCKSNERRRTPQQSWRGIQNNKFVPTPPKPVINASKIYFSLCLACPNQD